MKTTMKRPDERRVTGRDTVNLRLITETRESYPLRRGEVVQVVPCAITAVPDLYAFVEAVPVDGSEILRFVAWVAQQNTSQGDTGDTQPYLRNGCCINDFSLPSRLVVPVAFPFGAIRFGDKFNQLNFTDREIEEMEKMYRRQTGGREIQFGKRYTSLDSGYRERKDLLLKAGLRLES
ncbi:MAG: hypothetical protein AABX12_00950 [Nanoarchaeota archaeon]